MLEGKARIMQAALLCLAKRGDFVYKGFLLLTHKCSHEVEGEEEMLMAQ